MFPGQGNSAQLKIELTYSTALKVGCGLGSMLHIGGLSFWLSSIQLEYSSTDCFEVLLWIDPSPLLGDFTLHIFTQLMVRVGAPISVYCGLKI